MEEPPPSPRISYALASYPSNQPSPAPVDRPPLPPAFSWFSATLPFLVSVGLLLVLALTLWGLGFRSVWAVLIEVFFGLPACGLIWMLWLMTGQAIRGHWQTFLWGLLLGMLPVTCGLLLFAGSTEVGGSVQVTFALLLTYLPACDVLAVMTLTALKATRWFGLGLIGGLLLYMVGYGIILALLLAEI